MMNQNAVRILLVFSLLASQATTSFAHAHTGSHADEIDRSGRVHFHLNGHDSEHSPHSLQHHCGDDCCAVQDGLGADGDLEHNAADAVIALTGSDPAEHDADALFVNEFDLRNHTGSESELLSSLEIFDNPSLSVLIAETDNQTTLYPDKSHRVNSFFAPRCAIFLQTLSLRI